MPVFFYLAVRIAHSRKQCDHVPDANPDSHPITPESNGPETPASDIGWGVQVLSPSPGFHTVTDLDLHLHPVRTMQSY